MLENIELVVRDMAKKLIDNGWEEDEYRDHKFDRFFNDESARKDLRYKIDVGRCDQLVVKFNIKDNEFYLETTWSNLRMTDKLFEKVCYAKSLVDEGNEMIHQ